MREAIFIKENSEKWKRFEVMLGSKDRENPDETASLYVELIDDLSYARTFYPSSSVCNYLNDLSAKAHQVIYRNKKEKSNRIITFWKTELPTLFYNSRRQFLISFLVFIVSALVGAISAANDNSFVRLILGDYYVNETLDNIRKGDPMAIYHSHESFYMYVMIAINNIKVSFIMFTTGITYGIGTILSLFYNGIMLGAFQYFCYHEGALKQSLLALWLHGTIEISVCIVAGCAGLVMGSSLLFPGTYSRIQSLTSGAKQGVKIVIGTLPFFLIAAFIESFVTRHSGISPIFDRCLIFLSLTLIVGYFIIYPYLLNKNLKNNDTGN